MRSPTYGSVDVEAAKRIISNFKDHSPFKIYIGTDSDARDGIVTFATVLIVYKVGVGATYLYTLKRENRHYDMFTRLFEETHMSLEMANFARGNAQSDKSRDTFRCWLRWRQQRGSFSCRGIRQRNGIFLQTKTLLRLRQRLHTVTQNECKV